jgi:hypothetical protein
MNRFSRTQLLLMVLTAVIAAIGIFHDPDTVNADEIAVEPVPHERMPGYQTDLNIPKYESLSQAELVKLNATADEVSPTF